MDRIKNYKEFLLESQGEIQFFNKAKIDETVIGLKNNGYKMYSGSNKSDFFPEGSYILAKGTGKDPDEASQNADAQVQTMLRTIPDKKLGTFFMCYNRTTKDNTEAIMIKKLA